MTKKIKNPKATPMMRQYFEIKSRHPDKYLFFRLGDFYEMFDQDAVEASALLQITLTERNQIPMCGIPHHQLHRYVHKVIAQGKKIVIVEQDERPTSGNGLFTRRISQIITPGTTLDEMNLSAKEKNFIISFYFALEDKDREKSSESHGQTLFTEMDFAGFTALETTTGEVVFESALDLKILKMSLSRFFENYAPTEVVIPESYRGQKRVEDLIKNYPHLIINHQPDPDPDQVKKKINSIYAGKQNGKMIDDSQNYFLYRGLFMLLTYTEENYGERITYLQTPRQVSSSHHLILDQQTLVHLEIFKNNYDQSSKNSLLSVIDHTRTPMGSRKLQEILAFPNRNQKMIQKRLDQTDFFFQNPFLLKEIRRGLSQISDIERISSRIALRKALPRDFLSLKHSLYQVGKFLSLLIEKKPDWLEEIPSLSSSQWLTKLKEIGQRIEDTLIEEPHNDLSKGDFIKPTAHPRLHGYHRVKIQAESLLADLEIREREKTAIASLKIRYNDNLGYFFETSKNAAGKMPPHFLRKQSLISAERFVNEELLQLDAQIKEAKMHSVDLEREILEGLRGEMTKSIPLFQEISHFIAQVDLTAGFAELASVSRWVKPILNQGNMLRIEGGRHPVVEAVLSDPFIPNSITIGSDEDRIQIITGPNMSGKSTFLRQNALIVILAHIGSFVPAISAEIPLCDQIFTRIGSGDRLFQGESTFLVEMQETARILKQMTHRSLVIMDEIGRGTSTYDGLALAWSILEYINCHFEKRAKTLFATHYHELISLTREVGITHYHVTVREEGDRIVFLKKVVKGVVSRSYGIQVARLAGLPEEVIDHAQSLLQGLENKEEQMNPDKVSKINHNHSHEVGPREKREIEKKQNIPLWEKEILDFDVSEHSPLETAQFLNQMQEIIRRQRGQT